MDMTETIAPRSDQLNAEDFLAGPATVTITKVSKGDAEQPVNVVTAEYGNGRPYKPCKSMRRVMVAAWGPDASTYAGKRMTLYRDPAVTFGKDTPGGIRISHMSDLNKPLNIALTVTRGRRATYTVQPLTEPAPARRQATPKADPSAEAVAAFAAVGVTVEQMEDHVGKPRVEWDDHDLGNLRGWYQGLQANPPAEQQPEPDADQEWIGGQQ